MNGLCETGVPGYSQRSQRTHRRRLSSNWCKTSTNRRNKRRVHALLKDIDKAIGE